MNDKDDFEAVCFLQFGFDMKAFDAFVSTLEDEGLRNQMLREREDARAAFEAHHDEWLEACLRAMYRAGAYVSFRESATQAHDAQKAKAERAKGALERHISRVKDR